MSIVFEVDRVIAATPDRVWRHLTEPALIAAWMPGVESVTTPDGGPLAAGMTFQATARGREQASAVVDWVAGERLALQSTQGGFTAIYTYTLRAGDDGGTDASLAAECSAQGPVRLVAPLIRAMIRRADKDSLERLRAAVEAST